MLDYLCLQRVLPAFYVASQTGRCCDLDDITTVVANVSSLIESYPEGLIQRIFWEQQSKYNHLKDNIRCTGINCSFTLLSTSSTHQAQHMVEWDYHQREPSEIIPTGFQLRQVSWFHVRVCLCVSRNVSMKFNGSVKRS